MAIVGVLTTILSGNNAPLLASLASSEAAMKGYAAGTVTGSQVAQKALLGIGIGAAVGVVMAVRAAADFEDAFAGVRKTVDEADLTAAGMSFASLALVFRNMATEIPVAATELAAIGETAGALGIRATDIEAFTRTVALLGVTTDLSTDQAAESLGKVGTILGLTGGEYLDFADVLVNLGNKGASVESEIIEITKRFASAGLQAGLTTPQILAFSSAIASAGAQPEAAGSALSRMFGNMVLGAAKGTKAGQAFAKTTGMAFTDFADLVETDTFGAMMLVLDSLGDLDKFGQIRALDAMGIKGVNLTDAVRKLADTYDTNLVPALQHAGAAQGAVMTEAEKRFATFNVQLTLLGNSLNELGITLGTALLPPLTSFVQSVTGAVQSVSTWAAANPVLSSSLLPVITGVALLGLGVALLGAPFAAIIAIIALVMLNLDNLARGIQVVIDKFNEFIRAAQSVPGVELLGDINRNSGSNYEQALAGYGQPSGPTYAPSNPMIDLARGGREGQGMFGGGMMRDRGAPIQVNRTTNVFLDGKKIAGHMEKELYNNASQFSSGFAGGELR